MNFAKDTTFHRHLVLVNSLLPAVFIGIDAWRGKLGANPAEFVTRCTGVLTLIFLVVTLMVTPLRKMFGWNWLLKQRRTLGLFAFYYGTAHMLTYLAFDRDWHLGTVVVDVYKRPFIAIGMASYFMMVPLAVTSTNAMIKRLGGKHWALLHRLTYYVPIGGVIHYVMIVKSDITYPMVFAAAVLFLLGYRVLNNSRKAVKASESPLA